MLGSGGKEIWVMDYKDKAELVELKKLITKMQEDISNLYELYNQIINQNTLQSQQNLAQGQENGANAQSRIYSQHDGQTISPTDLRQFSFNSQQNSSSHRRDDERNSTLRSLLASTDSPRTPNERGISDSGERNFAESRSTARSRRGGAQSRESGAISKRGGSLGAGLEEFAKIYGIEIQADEQELKELENKIKEWKQISLKSRELAERLMNNFLEKSIQELQHSQSVFYADALPKAYAKFATAILTLVNLGYKLDQQNATKIQKILKIELNKDLVR